MLITRGDGDVSCEGMGDEVHIHLVCTDSVSSVLIERWLELLSEEELARYSRLATSELKLEFVVSHGVLRELLGAYLGTDPRYITFALGQFGKPRVVTPEMRVIEFNVSHSYGVVALAFSREHTLGIDIERIDIGTVSEGLIESVFTRRNGRS